jgi:mRNA-degrading endonuclease RelE of RelBE toxin-antitoxin system
MKAENHLRALAAQQRAIVLDEVQAQLVYEPLIATRNRKPMRPNPVAPWELRIGALRVYYDVKEEPDPTVQILAVGIKDRNQVSIGNEVVDL